MEQTQAPEGSILIAHIADVHLRDTQYATVRRGIDFYEAFERAVTIAAEKADIIVCAGDIFDRPRPSPKIIGQLMRIDQLLVEMNAKMLTVTGNHDWCDPTWLSTLFPNSATKSAGIIQLDDSAYETHGIRIVGVQQRNAGAFRRDIAEIEMQVRKADVVVFHGLVSGVVPFYAGLQDPLRVDELPVAKNNLAWLLGDIHIQGYLNVPRPGGGECLVGYPGSLEMCSASEPKDKSIPLIRVTKGKQAVVEDRIPTDTRPFVTAVVDSEDALNNLMKSLELVAEQHPVVSVKFDRQMPQTINRIHSMLDAQRAVIRCYPLPDTRIHAAPTGGLEERATDEEVEYGMEHFVSQRFEDNEDLGQVALALLTRGDQDASNIISDLIEKRLATAGVREEELE